MFWQKLQKGKKNETWIDLAQDTTRKRVYERHFAQQNGTVCSTKLPANGSSC